MEDNLIIIINKEVRNSKSEFVEYYVIFFNQIVNEIEKIIDSSY